jgi:hypothetical protein
MITGGRGCEVDDSGNLPPKQGAPGADTTNRNPTIEEHSGRQQVSVRKRDLLPGAGARRTAASMTPQEFETRIVEWARRQPSIEALIQIGSRVQPGSHVDNWSDWDYHLIARDLGRYQNNLWPAEIAPCWCSHYERIEDGVNKLGVIFEDGLEADFVLLSPWKMRLVYWAIAHPGLRHLYPRALLSGIHNTRRVLRPGYKVVCGGVSWERRLRALNAPWPERLITAEEFEHTTLTFWRHAVWLLKKIARGELRASARWYTLEMFDHVYLLLAEEARLAGRKTRTEARSAERWLDAGRLRQTEITTAPDRQIMARALLEGIDLFEEVSRSVATSRSFELRDYSAVAAWLRAELGKLTDRP